MKDLTGQRFGRLVVLGPTEERRNRYMVWEGLCDCDNKVFVDTQNLKNRPLRSEGGFSTLTIAVRDQ